MKFLDRFNLAIFSIIILAIALVICIVSFGWLNLSVIQSGIEYIINDSLANNIALGVSIVLIILALKSIFFNSYSKDKMQGKDGILMENENGKLLVSKDTIESLTNTVVKSFESAESVTTKVVVDEESHIKVFITLFVHPDAIIKDLSNKLQADVKNTIKKSTDLDVTEVNIRIKNISVKKEPNIKE